jgi:hypothetical protein
VDESSFRYFFQEGRQKNDTGFPYGCHKQYKNVALLWPEKTACEKSILQSQEKT